ncbi:MAG: molybdopterin-guanine dinucleotide biosynthesis protein A [Porticoccus sp.]
MEGLLVDALLIVPVDTPLLTPAVLQHLIRIGEMSRSAVCYEDCYLPLYLPVNAVLSNDPAEVFAEGSTLPRFVKNYLLP